jgi:hypothetical protein
VADSTKVAVQGHPGAKKAAAVLGFSVFSRGRGRRSGGVHDGFERKEREEQQSLAHFGGKGEGRRGVRIGTWLVAT